MIVEYTGNGRYVETETDDCEGLTKSGPIKPKKTALVIATNADGK